MISDSEAEVREAEEEQEEAMNDDGEVQVLKQQPFPNKKLEKSSLNAAYGNSIGFGQLLSLILNSALMVYAQVGLSAVILSNQKRIETASATAPAPAPAPATTNNTNSNSNSSAFNVTGSCVESDFLLWQDEGGASNKTKESNYCAKKYNANGCLLDQPCTTECFSAVFGYTEPCAACFAAIPLCSLNAGCAFICQQQGGENADCSECTKGCNAEFKICTGLPDAVESTLPPAAAAAGAGSNNSTDNTTTISPSPSPSQQGIPINSAAESSAHVCARQQEGVDVEDVAEFYVAYQLQFFTAIRTGWTSNAELLAVIVFMFSGLWPYVKNAILLATWYLPLTEQRRDRTLLWLRRVGKYTLVDIYVRAVCWGWR